MGGGLMQLVAYGAQDIYLTGNPQITFFKVVYRRHTNFSMEAIEQTINGIVDWDNSIDCTISRNGDLVGRTYVQLERGFIKFLAEEDEIVYSNWTHTLLKQMEVEVGGQLIDRHYGHWLTVYNDLTQQNDYYSQLYPQVNNSSQVLFRRCPWIDTSEELEDGTDYNGDNMGEALSNELTYHLNTYLGEEGTEYQRTSSSSIGWKFESDNYYQQHNDFMESDILENHSFFSDHDRKYYQSSSNEGSHWDTAEVDEVKQTLPWMDAYIPLQFWFCRNNGLALPLIALQYHEVKLSFKFCSQKDITNTSSTTELSSSKLKVFCDYIYLDTDERRRFAQISHEYLIEQLQFQEFSDKKLSHSIVLNHPVKELIWVGNDSSELSTYGKIHDTPSQPKGLVDSNYHLQLNGHDRMAARPLNYFTKCQVWQHHTGVGSLNIKDSVAVYSFALKPEEHQPSGTCNFSRIDVAELICDKPFSCNLYAVNYNVLRIMSGMGGLAYSN